MQKLTLGLLGLGQIGTGLYKILTAKKRYFEQQAGLSFQIKGIAVRHKNKKRSVRVPKDLLTTNAMRLIKDPSVDIIVELIGGTRDARRLVMAALNEGKHVVTANKALLAEHGDEIFEAAGRRRCWIAFEASVGGGIPVMKALREGLVANRIESIHSIINGTSNYILSKMTEEHLDFQTVLKQAQAKGYAEADPRFDIEGIDAAHKLAILVRFAFGGRVKFKEIYCEGISSIRSEDIAFAEEFGYRIKLLAIAKMSKAGIEARVQPTLLPKNHILANVGGAYNAILFCADEVGETLFYGKGAGPKPTASAVISDLVDIAKRGQDRFFDPAMFERCVRKKLKIKSMSSILSRYYLRFLVLDRPGILARISKILGKHSISISDCFQKESSVGKFVPLILLTHNIHERNVRKAIQEIDRLNIVRGKSQVIRIEQN